MITYHTSMVDPMSGKPSSVKYVVRIVDPNSTTFEWYEKKHGKEAMTLKIDYTRK